MLSEADDYIDWDEFWQYFTKRGRPKYYISKEDKDKQARSKYAGPPPTDKNEHFFENVLSSKKRNKKKEKSWDSSYSKSSQSQNEHLKNANYFIDKSNKSKKKKYSDSSEEDDKIEGYDSDPEYRKFDSPRKGGNYSMEKVPKTKSVHQTIVQTLKKGKTHSFQTTKAPLKIRASTQIIPKKDINYKDYTLECDKKERPYTVPEPFEFDSRNSKKKPTIRERKVQEMVEEIKAEEQNAINHRFRANEVPNFVKENRFEKLMEEEHEKRKFIKENSMAITLQNQKPFSFYNREDKARRKNKYEREKFVFKAKEIPWYCSKNLLKTIEEREEVKRRERIERMAQQSLAKSKLPPRMAKHEKTRKAKEIMVEKSDPVANHHGQFTFHPGDRKIPPNFENIHKTFQTLLDNKRRNKRPTKPIPFEFNETRKVPKKDYLDRDNIAKKQSIVKKKKDPLEKLSKFKNTAPEYQPPSTKKWENSVQHNKKIQEKKMEKENQKKKEEEQRIKNKKDFAPRVQKSTFLEKDLTLQLENDKKRKEEQKDRKKQEKKYEKWVKDIKEDVKKKPLLFEDPKKFPREMRISEMKKVARYAKLLKDSKINPRKFLPPEKLELLDDYEYLMKNGYKNELEKETEKEKSQYEKDMENLEKYEYKPSDE